jgi:formate dehydrogenase major subunit
VTAGKYTSKKWIGDVPDGGWYPLQDPDGTWRTDAKYPFIMKPEGHARLFGMGRADGPFPEHYEPVESPLTENPVGHNTMINPAIKLWHVDKPEGNEIGTPDQYSVVATTYRVTEHWQAGAMTRNLPWLTEMMPSNFVELSPELAEEQGIVNGDRVLLTTARGCFGGAACVTKRFRPFILKGNKTVHEVGVPWHWGFMSESCGCSANALTPHVGDANTMIPEFKAFLCKVEKCSTQVDPLRAAKDGHPAGQEVT